MKLGIILETKELEKAWNAFRFAVTAKKAGHEVKVFLMGEAVIKDPLDRFVPGPRQAVILAEVLEQGR